MIAYKFIGPRVIKTGIAVFITALVCIELNLPVIFAVITAIVTTEPTAAQSLQKGIIRLPAAAIGAGFALLCDLFFGQTALTFALVAMLTILVCYHMKLDSGTLVATLTAVVMIPGLANEMVLTEFLLRLSGTSLGIIISTLVNFAVLPPKFGPLLVEKVNRLYTDVADYLEESIETNIDEPAFSCRNKIRKLNQELEKAYQLSEYQHAEWNYRRNNQFEERSFYFLQKKLAQLQKLLSHISNIYTIGLTNIQLTAKEKKLILDTVNKIKTICVNPDYETSSDHNYLQLQLYKLLKKEAQQSQKYQKKEALLYELIAVTHCLEVLQHATKEELLFSNTHSNYPAYIFPKKIQYD
ncbi:aromatic acid exporter family protein [Bacillaceae bacterium IKA-2]|nr:aromatic acid exporter family protein [Bacillaceae bacterium IKA-2]